MTATGEGQRRSASAGAARVVVVGAGFGGLAAVRRLARSGMQVTLVDRNVYSTFQPLLYEVATAGLTSSDVAYPARSESRRYRATFRHGELASIDPSARRIRLADGSMLASSPCRKVARYLRLSLRAGYATSLLVKPAVATSYSSGWKVL